MRNTCSLLHVLEGSFSSSLTLKIPIQEFFHSVQTSNQLTYFFFFFFTVLRLSNVNTFLLIFLRFSVLSTMMTPSQIPTSPCSHFCTYLTFVLTWLVKSRLQLSSTLDLCFPLAPEQLTGRRQCMTTRLSSRTSEICYISLIGEISSSLRQLFDLFSSLPKLIISLLVSLRKQKQSEENNLIFSQENLSTNGI